MNAIPDGHGPLRPSLGDVNSEHEAAEAARNTTKLRRPIAPMASLPYLSYPARSTRRPHDRATRVNAE
jgi:hypothetical protein